MRNLLTINARVRVVSQRSRLRAHLGSVTRLFIGGPYVAVTLDDEPGRELLFRTDELKEEVTAAVMSAAGGR